jgi:2-polyprenyl-3-methyl-5-hydroxy-6-metoxy-1,4-benzoquinol methylase
METTARYDAAAPRWEHKIESLGYSAAYRRFLNTMVVPSGRVLDVGTGTGAFACCWLAAGGSQEITLLDPSRSMLVRADAAVRRCGATPEIVEAAIEDHCPYRRYFVILAAHVVEHSSDPAIAFHRFSEWLEPQGRLVLVVSRPHWCNWLIWLRYRHRWFSESEIVFLGRQAGLRHVATHSFTKGPPSRTSLGYVFIKT